MMTLFDCNCAAIKHYGLFVRSFVIINSNSSENKQEYLIIFFQSILLPFNYIVFYHDPFP